MTEYRSNSATAGSTHFAGTRARFQRVTDARIYNGWTVEFTEYFVILNTESAVAIEKGDEFHIEIMGKNHRAICRAVLIETAAQKLTFRVVGAPQTTKAHEGVRLVAKNIGAKLKFEDTEAEADVLDIAPSGVGLNLPFRVSRGDLCKVVLTTQTGEIDFEGEVRYCRALEDTDPEQFRVGVQFKDIDRIQRARWLQQFANVA